MVPGAILWYFLAPPDAVTQKPREVPHMIQKEKRKWKEGK
jgi:hypothetical protein